MSDLLDFGRVHVLFNLSAKAYFNRLVDINNEDWDRAARDGVEVFGRGEGLVICGG